MSSNQLPKNLLRYQVKLLKYKEKLLRYRVNSLRRQVKLANVNMKKLTWGPGLLDMGLIGLPPPSTLLPHPSHQIILTKSQIGLPRAFLPLFYLPLFLSLDPQRPSNHSPTNLFSPCPCLISSSCNAIYPHQGISAGLPNPPNLLGC